MFLSEGQFFDQKSTPTGWFHVVMNYIGPNDGEGIKLFLDGTEVASDRNLYKYSEPGSAGDGRIVLGRPFTNKDQNYTSVQVDEITYFNSSLSNGEIQLLARGF